MANASVQSAVARIGAIDYTRLDELKTVKIPKNEQEVVAKLMGSPKEQSPSSLRAGDCLLKLFETGSPLKCVRMPKREQRIAQMYIDDHPDED